MEQHYQTADFFKEYPQFWEPITELSRYLAGYDLLQQELETLYRIVEQKDQEIKELKERLENGINQTT